LRLIGCCTVAVSIHEHVGNAIGQVNELTECEPIAREHRGVFEQGKLKLLTFVQSALVGVAR
jgi:hypothetical protein